MKESLKLGVLVSHPIQYFVPVYRELTKNQEIKLTVLYRTRVGVDEYHDEGFGQTVKWDIPLLDGYQHQFLSEKNKIAGIEWSVAGMLLRNRFDILLVHGYSSVTNLLAILVAKLIGTKVLMRGDTRLQAHHQESVLKSIFKRVLFKLCNGFVTIGALNRAYYAHYGVPKDKLFFAPFCVRNEQFEVTPKARQEARTAVRNVLKIDQDALIVLFASKLIKLKRTDELIRSFSALINEFPSAFLVIAGSGEEESNLRELADSLDLRQIRFIGFQNQTQLPALYAAADIFVLPSHLEAWGLVINEIMAAGVPVIVSSEVGAAPDLVEGKGTGLVYPCGDVDALSNALRSLLAAPDLRKKMSENGEQFIKNWSVGECVKGTVIAAMSVTENKRIRL